MIYKLNEDVWTEHYSYHSGVIVIKHEGHGATEEHYSHKHTFYFEKRKLKICFIL